MQILVDRSGTHYDCIFVGKRKVKLQTTKFPEISHIYKEAFIKGAIKAGLLTEIPSQLKLSIEKPLKPIYQRPAHKDRPGA